MKKAHGSMFNKPRPMGWGKNAHNGNAKGRKHGIARATRADRDLLELVPPPTRRGKGDYLFANCVVLAAAVFGPSSRAWAEQLLPSARQLDARRLS
jgi:hypothetical protein